MERMGTRGFEVIFCIVVFAFLPLCSYHNPILKRNLNKVEGRKIIHSLFRGEGILLMAPKRKEGPIPVGWTLEAEVRKDGSKVPFYYCQETDQQFDTYVELMCYVRYAKRKGFSIYDQICKSVKRTKNLEKDNDVTESKKKSALSTRRKSSSKPHSSTVELSLDSKPSTSSRCTDN